MSLATKNRFTSKLGNVIEVERGLWRIFTYGGRGNVDVRGNRSEVYRVVDELLEGIEREIAEEEESTL